MRSSAGDSRKPLDLGPRAFRVYNKKAALGAIAAFTAALPFAPIGGAMIGAIGGSPALRIAGMIGTIVALLLLGYGLFRRIEQKRVGQLVVDDAGVAVDGERVAASADIDGGAFLAAHATIQGERRPSVQLRSGNKVVGEIDVAGEEEAYAVLERLGVGVQQQVMTFDTLAPVSRAFHLLLLTSMILGTVASGVGAALFWPLLPVGIVAVVTALALQAWGKVDVGSDGLLLRHRLGKRFIAFDELEQAEGYVRGFDLVLKSGERLRVGMTQNTHLSPRMITERNALLSRVAAAQQAHRQGMHGRVAAQLAQHGRSVDTWWEALMALGQSYRDGAVDDVALWRVVEDATSPATARGAAAALLARTSNPSGQERLRIAAEASANPKLRIAFEAAAAGNEKAALEAAADEAAADEAAATRSRSW
jgi:hypothetical protein